MTVGVPLLTGHGTTLSNLSRPRWQNRIGQMGLALSAGAAGDGGAAAGASGGGASGGG